MASGLPASVSANPSPGFVVADCGARPDIRYAAAGLARSGLLHRYVTDVAFGPDSPTLQLLCELPPRYADPVLKRLSLRLLPPDVRTDQLVRAASVLGWSTFVSRFARLKPQAARRIVVMRDREFDRQVAKMLTGSEFGLLAPFFAAAHMLRRARDLAVPSVLQYPIAHHAFARRVLAEEAELQPEYASTLQFVGASSAEEARLEEECDLANKILTFCPAHTESFLSVGYPRDKFVEVPPGVDLELFRPSSPNIRQPRDGVFRVVFAGQLTQRKGLSYLIDGFREAAIPNSELLLVGEIRGGSAPWTNVRGVRHLRAQPRSLLPPIYESAHVFAMPSLIEGFGLTPLEAMATGVPVIVTPPVCETVVRDGIDGWIVPFRDSHAIASRLVQMYEEPELRCEMGANAHRRAQDYSWLKYGDKVARAFELEFSGRS